MKASVGQNDTRCIAYLVPRRISTVGERHFRPLIFYRIIDRSLVFVASVATVAGIVFPAHDYNSPVSQYCRGIVEGAVWTGISWTILPFAPCAVNGASTFVRGQFPPMGLPVLLAHECAISKQRAGNGGRRAVRGIHLCPLCADNAGRTSKTIAAIPKILKVLMKCPLNRLPSRMIGRESRPRR